MENYKNINLKKIKKTKTEESFLELLENVHLEHKEEIHILNKSWIKRLISIENLYRKALGIPEIKEDYYNGYL